MLLLHRHILYAIVTSCLALTAHSSGEAPATSPSKAPVVWPERLFRTPATYPAPKEYDEDGVQSIFIEGPDYKGKPTRIFAYYALPAGADKGKVPGIVLIHGGGGTAFADWVRLWTQRGYAAIAPDTCGCLPGGFPRDRPRHDASGPPGWELSFPVAEAPVGDQWGYHAVASAILSHSLLRSMPQVDAERIGVTGISWGGYLVCLAAAADPRYKFAVPVYGCGFLGENSMWSDRLTALGEKGRKWLQLWDARHYLPYVKTPMLWVTGTNDFAYPMDSLQKSYRLTPTPPSLCIRLRMRHSHGGPGEKPEEIMAFAEHHVRSGPPLARITGQGREGAKAWISFENKTRIAGAELLYTRDQGIWEDRGWEAVPAELDVSGRKAWARLPEGARVYYLNLIDANGLVVSSQHEIQR